MKTRARSTPRPRKTVQIHVDGEAYEVAAGSRLLAALDEIGALETRVTIPHLCWHPTLGGDEGCGLCQVQIEGEAGLQPACATPVREGLRVSTRTPAAHLVREGVLARLLAEHPLECPQCDKSGECQLQDLTFAHRFAPEAGPLGPAHAVAAGAPGSVPMGSTLLLDARRCIRCGLCVRFCEEVSGAGRLVLSEGEVGIALVGDAPFEDAYSLNLVDLCPVGALTARDFRHRIRVWDLQAVEGICFGCSRGCNLVRDVARGRIFRQRPRRNDAVNGSWLCDAGRLSHRDVERPDRLRGAWLRSGAGVLEPVSIDAAIAAAAGHLQEILSDRGPGAIGGIASAHASNEDLLVLQRLLVALSAPTAGLVVPNGPADSLLRTAEAASNAAGARAFGFDDGRRLLEAIRNGEIRALIVLGHDLLAPGWLASETELERLDAVIWIDWCTSPIQRVARVILASLHAAEKDGSFTNCDGLTQSSSRAIEPGFEAWSEANLLTRLARAMHLIGADGSWQATVAAPPRVEGQPSQRSILGQATR